MSRGDSITDYKDFKGRNHLVFGHPHGERRRILFFTGYSKYNN